MIGLSTAKRLISRIVPSIDGRRVKIPARYSALAPGRLARSAAIDNRDYLAILKRPCTDFTGAK